MSKPDSIAMPPEHDFISMFDGMITACRHCLMVKRADGENKPCKGPAKLSLRKCDHEWNNEGMNPTHCLKCGMGIMAHAMMECP